jgi:hypothetical protein
MPDAAPEEYMTPAEAGAVLGKASWQLRALEAAGELEAARTEGGTRRYLAAGVAAMRERLDASVPGGPGELLTPAQVAGMFHVHPRTAARWGEDGRLAVVRTRSGRRFRGPEVRARLRGDGGGAGGSP